MRALAKARKAVAGIRSRGGPSTAERCDALRARVARLDVAASENDELAALLEERVAQVEEQVAGLVAAALSRRESPDVPAAEHGDSDG